MVSPTISFSGIASGLDTSAMIDALMTVERQPINRMQVRRQEYDTKLNAWTAINSKVSDLRTSVDAITSSSDFNSFVGATSNNEDAVEVTVTGTPPPSGINLSVNQLAANHQVATGSGFGADDALVGAGTFTINTSGDPIEVTTDSATTLEGLAQQINNSNGDVTASVIEVGLNDHRLVLTAKDSGEDSQFTVSSDLGGFASSEVLAAGADAKLRIGDPVTGLQITRPTNTFENVIDGVTFEAKQVTSEPVRIEVSRDTESAADAIKSMVNATNALLRELERQTSYNAESNTASPLTNDATARNMTLSLRDSMNEIVANSGSYSTIAELGIEFERDGSYSIDEAKLNEALDSDFESVISLFTRGGSSDSGDASYLSATSSTVAGTYGVVVDTAASVPEVTGSLYSVPGQLEEFNIQYRGTNALVTVANGATLEQAIESINSDLASYGIDQVVADSVAITGGDALRISVPDAYGSNNELAIWNDTAFGLNATVAGTDVVGTIGGEAASGSGRTLTATEGLPTGLSVRVSATADDVGAGSYTAGSVTISQGLSGRLDSWLDSYEGVDGEIARARSEWDTRITDVNDSIEAMEQRMALREAQLRREFTSMESALAQLQGQGNYLASLLPSLGTTS